MPRKRKRKRKRKRESINLTIDKNSLYDIHYASNNTPDPTLKSFTINLFNTNKSASLESS